MAASLCLGILAAEGIVRLLAIAPEISRINPGMKKTVFRISDNPLLGYLMRKNYRDSDADLVTSYPYTNSHGFRDIERRVEKPNGVRRILLLGDPIVAGHVNIRSLDHLMSRELETLMEPENVEVLNIGMTGYCTRGEMELLQQEGLKFSPDLVILVFFGNDYTDLNMELGYVTPSLPVQFFVINSHLFRYLGIEYNIFNLRDQLGVQEIAWQSLTPIFHQQPDRMERIRSSDDASSATIKKHLESIGSDNVHASIPALKAMANEQGFQLLIGVWPIFQEHSIFDVETYGGTITPIFGEELLEIERLADASGIPRFRFSPGFHADWARKRERGEIGETETPWEYYCSEGDPGHPNPKGTKVAARIMKGILQSNPELLESNPSARNPNQSNSP